MRRGVHRALVCWLRSTVIKDAMCAAGVEDDARFRRKSRKILISTQASSCARGARLLSKDAMAPLV